MKGDKLTKKPTVGDRVEMIGCHLGNWVEIGNDCMLENVSVDDFSYMGRSCIMQNARIGKFSNIAANVRIGPTDHPMERPSLHHFTYRKWKYGFGHDDRVFFEARKMRVCHIGHDTWIGHGAIIMPGVSIGIGSVVGSGAVVTKSVPDYCIAVGVPAKVIRRRFTEEQADELHKIAWWDWKKRIIKEREADFHLAVDEFIAKYRKSGAS